MSSYTITNLKQVDDQGARFGYGGKLEARFARVPLELERSGISHFRVAAGFRTPFGHRHREQEQVYLVVSGSARLRVDDDVVELAPSDAGCPRTRCGRSRAARTAPRSSRSAPPRFDSPDVEMTPGWWSD